MPDKVVDASVLASWCFREPRQNEALELISGSTLFAPTLLGYELTSIAAKKAAADPESFGDYSDHLAAALALPIKLRTVDHSSVLQLAVNTGLSPYDASYLLLARVLNAPLLTFDRQLAGAAGSTP